MADGSARVGTSGWSYDHWDGVLYEPGLPVARRRDVYASQFDTVELDASFYRWPRDVSFTTWRDRLPKGFLLSVKAPRTLTHARRLRDRDDDYWMTRIQGSMRTLGAERRGPLLFQLPPDLERDDELIDSFFARIPEWLDCAVEFRHDSWNAEPVFEILERRRVAYCVTSGAHLPCVLRATAHDVYVRMHGPSHDRLYEGSYSDADLAWWADRIREWEAQGHRVLVYFNNDGAGHAVRNARTLRAMLA